MEIIEARFIVSNTEVAKCPKPDKPEYAFIGRSNVGKSSLINMLTNKKAMAKISVTERKKWEKFLRKYILKRENLYCLFVLIDSRHEAQVADLEFMEWLG